MISIPRVLAKVRPLTHLSGGAGVSKKVGLGDGAADAPKVIPVDPLAFPAGDSPTDAYNTYLEWLSHWPLSSQVNLLTPGSRNYIASLHMSPAYAEFILLAEYGKSFEVVERDDLALLYFTGTPFISPHFFVKQDGRWRMDMEAEVRNTRGACRWGIYLGLSWAGRQVHTHIRRSSNYLEGLSSYSQWRQSSPYYPGNLLTLAGIIWTCGSPVEARTRADRRPSANGRKRQERSFPMPYF